MEMSVHLCIDIGNTFSKMAIFVDNKIVTFARYKRLGFSSIQKIIDTHHPTSCIVSTTRKRNPSLIKRLQTNLRTLELDHLLDIPFTNKYETPATLGRDRIAAVAGAITIKPKKNLFIADLGSCITYDFVDKKKNYLGGNIAPGLQMRIDAMHDYTDKLPLVDQQLNPFPLGKNTTEALQNGAAWGIILEIRSYISHLEGQYGRINVILTGGDATFFAEHFKKKIFAEPKLVLIGLNEILKHNAI